MARSVRWLSKRGMLNLPEDLRETVLEYLKEHNTMTLATAADCSPWAAAVFYVNEGFTLYFLSEPQSRHSRNAALNPAVAVTIHEDYPDWRQIKGVQMEGRVERVTSRKEKAKAMAAYVGKYPFVAEMLLSSGALFKLVSRKARGVKWYRFAPTRVLFTDNERGFGHREEVAL